MYTVKYKFFRAKRNKHLKQLTWISHDIWNYFLGWQKMRYELGLPLMSLAEMGREFTVLKNAHPEMFAHWRELNSNAGRETIKRLYLAYELFFQHAVKRPPKFRSVRKTYSFTMRINGFRINGDKIRIQDKYYRFNLSRPIIGKIKYITVKEDSVGDFYLCVTTDHVNTEILPKTGKAAGYDFGLKTMFTCSDGTLHESPEFYKQSQSKIAAANRNHSRKKKGSNNRERARKVLVRTHRKIARQREDHHWKLAKDFVHEYDDLCFETLSFESMKRIWGKKVSDISPSAFHSKLQHQAKKHGKEVHYIDRFEPTTKTCSNCGYVQEKNDFNNLKIREWTCPSCKQKHNRDVNASINILKVGASTFGLENVRLAIASGSRRLHPKSKPHNPHRKAKVP